MKYRHLNEISKYFKPVDYIEELTPEEEEKKDLQNYYSDNMGRLQKLSEEFDVNKDSVNFTFYKTLYQTGEKTTVKINNLGLDSPTDNPGLGYLLEVIIRHTLDYIGEMLSEETNRVNGYVGISAEIEHYTDDDSSPETMTVIYIPDVKKYKPIFYPDYSSGDRSWYELNPYVYMELNHDDTVFIRFVLTRKFIHTENLADNIFRAVRKLGKIQRELEDPTQYTNTKYTWEFPYKPASPEEILNALSNIDIDVPDVDIYKLHTLCTWNNIKDERIFNTLNFYFDNYYEGSSDFSLILHGFIYCMQIKYFYSTDINKLLEHPVKNSTDLLTRVLEDVITPTVNYLKNEEHNIKSLITDFSNSITNTIGIDPEMLYIKFTLTVENITKLDGQSAEPIFRLDCDSC